MVVHEAADFASLCANDVTMVLKGNGNFNRHWDQILDKERERESGGGGMDGGGDGWREGGREGKKRSFKKSKINQ